MSASKPDRPADSKASLAAQTQRLRRKLKTPIPAPRIELENKISLRFPHFQGFLTEYCSNVSISGMFIQSNEPRPPGEILDFELNLIDGLQLIRGSGEVIWVRLADEGPDLPAGMGIRFLGLDAQSRRLIRWAVEKQISAGGEPFDLNAYRADALPVSSSTSAVRPDEAGQHAAPPYAGSSEDSHRVSSEIAEPATRYRSEELPYSEHVARLVGQELSRLEARYAGRGRSLAEFGAPREVAERMVATLPSPSLWDDLLGPFYGPGQVARILGNISRQAVADRRHRWTLLGLKTADGHWVYPAFQFDRRNSVLTELPELLQILAASGIDGWSLAGWLMSPLRSLEGETAIDWLRADRDHATLLAVTRDAARRFAQ